MSSESLKRAREMREIAYMNFTDAMKGLKHATSLIDQRVQKEGPAANYSSNTDLLEWAQSVWRHSNSLYMLDEIIHDISKDQILKDEVTDGNVASPGDDSTGG